MFFRIAFFLFIIFGLTAFTENDLGVKERTKVTPKEQSIIIEVTQNPQDIKNVIRRDFPNIEVVATFDTLLQALALKANSNELTKLARTDFIKGFYPAQMYVTTLPISFTKYELDTKELFEKNTNIHSLILNSEHLTANEKDETITYPQALNDTNYTGKGIKVAVIDTGIDMEHPDLKKNYQGGFDLVDLDEIPKETTKEEGMPTMHGTHVAGIIAANGQIKGVAPDAEIYAYRALGPGGVGSSIQVIAAMEQALKDGVDIINLSLGNTVNGPDYPTSKAVVEASRQGIAVIVANGNAGPDNWTIGAPATAKSAFSVGAYSASAKHVYVTSPLMQKKFSIKELPTSKPWNLTRDYKVTPFKRGEQLYNRIVIIRQDEPQLYDVIEQTIQQGAVAILIQQIKKEKKEQPAPIEIETSDIPIALISERGGNELLKNSVESYVKTVIEREEHIVAPFSSRGPVTVDWQIKPNVIAPGVKVLSTIPNGYDAYSGTSMATPHVAGVVALIKEARPDWTNEKIFAALETSAVKLVDKKGKYIPPFIQGSGLVQPNAAIETEVIVENGLLTFGKTNDYLTRTTAEVTFHNLSDKRQEVSMATPPKMPGLIWQIPHTFSIEAQGKKTVPISLHVNELLLQEGMYDGWIDTRIGENNIPLPFIFINRTDTYKKVAGLSLQLHPINQQEYTYELYVSEQAKLIQVQLFDPESLIFTDTLLELDNVQPGMHEGKIKRSNIKEKGMFYGLVIVQLMSGEVVNYEMPIYIE